MSDMRKTVESLIDKAAETSDATDSLKFSQAALNAANAYSVITDIKIKDPRSGASS